MIPRQDEFNFALQDGGVVEEVGPSYTHRLHVNSERIYGHIDNREAVKQMIYKQINTEYGELLIYPNFGMPLKDLFGKPKPYAYVELVRRIEECLIRDDRILAVYDFEYLHDRSPNDELSMSFSVETVYGDIEIQNEWKFDYDNRL